VNIRERIGQWAVPDAMEAREALPGLVDAVCELKETVTLQGRKLEDIGFANIDGTPRNIGSIRKECYSLWQSNPLAWYCSLLLKSFIFGGGLAKPKARNEDIQKYIDDLWDDPGNQKFIFGIDGAGGLSDKLLYEGELSLGLYVADSGLFTARCFDAEEIAEVIVDPDDRGTVLGYRRIAKRREYDFANGRYKSGASRKIYHPDTSNPNAESEEAFKDVDGNLRAYIYHLKENTDVNDHRGFPALERARPWLKEHKKFMERRCAIQAAMAAYIAKVTAKGGGSAALAGLKQQLQSTFASGANATGERNPAPMAGYWLQNEALDLEQLKFDTGGASAKEDLRALLMMVGIALGWLPHYLGELETSNLSTAEKVELVTLKVIEYLQNWWAKHYRSIIEFGLMQAAQAGTYRLPVEVEVKGSPASWRLRPSGADIDITIDIDFPPITLDVLKDTLDALGGAVESGIMRRTKAAEIALRTVRDNNIAEELERFEDEAAAQQRQLDGRGNPANGDGNGDEPPVQQTREALETLILEARGILEDLESGDDETEED
jgi:hypothetical protein